MKEINVTGHFRSDLGKKASKRMRKKGLIPCNLYGEKTDEKGAPVATALAIPMTELRKVVYTPHVYVINMDVDGQKFTAILKELQFHPVTDALLHVDFLQISENKPLAIAIPVNLVGHAIGVRNGGRMNLSIRKITVKAIYTQIPEKLDVDVTNLKIGKSIKVGDLHYEGLEFVTSKAVVVCSVKKTRAASMANMSEGEEDDDAEKSEAAE